MAVLMRCACGKSAMDGVRCKIGAFHETLEVSRKKRLERERAAAAHAAPKARKKAANDSQLAMDL